jgi:hypothetical protein
MVVTPYRFIDVNWLFVGTYCSIFRVKDKQNEEKYISWQIFSEVSEEYKCNTNMEVVVAVNEEERPG